MPRFRQADWYETPHYYDILLAEDTERDGDFLEALFARYGRSRGRRVLEPACGSGRLLVELAGRGWRVTGLDLEEKMVGYARARLAQAGLRGEVLHAPMQAFDLPRRFDLAHCLISTFKHLLDEQTAVAALRCVARSLAPGGLFVLGLHLTDYACEGRQRERWEAGRGGTRVVCNLQSWPPDRRRRRERMRSRLTTVRRGVVDRMESHWEFRTYDEAELSRLVGAVRGLEHVATHDFSYDLEREVHPDQLDRVVVLRRRASAARGL
jgi:SAM-dependent methyltransferase